MFLTNLAVPVPMTLPWDQYQRRRLLDVASGPNVQRHQPQPLLGIIGGIGPLADVRLAQLMVKLDNKRCKNSIAAYDSDAELPASLRSGFTADNCHTPYLLYSNPRYIPNNNLANMRIGPSSVDALVDSAHALAAAGANVIGMACTAAHTWREEVERRLNDGIRPLAVNDQQSEIKVLDLLDLTAATVANDGHATVGLVEVDGTIHAGMFEEAMRRHGVEPTLPDIEDQMKIMELVSRIKRGEEDIELLRHSMGRIVSNLAQKNTNITAVVFGCTDIAAIMGGYQRGSMHEEEFGDQHMQIYDTLQILAEAIIRISN